MKYSDGPNWRKSPGSKPTSAHNGHSARWRQASNVSTAHSGVTGLPMQRLVLAAQEVPDLILLDVMMPRIDGFEVLERLKSNPDTQSIPVIMVTAKGQGNDESQAMRTGAWDYITKPWGPDEVEDRVRMALDYLNSRS